jgi:hypothetical protein
VDELLFDGRCTKTREKEDRLATFNNTPIKPEFFGE